MTRITMRNILSVHTFVLALILTTPIAFAFPGFTSVQPLSGSSVNSTTVQYTLNEDLDYGFITWQRTGGTADSFVHIQALEGSELLTGTFTGLLTNYPVLIDGAIYSVSFAGGNVNGDAVTVVRNSVLYDISPPVIQSVTIPDQAYTTGDTITITITADSAGYSPYAISVNGVAATSFQANGATYTADYTVQAADPDRPAGTIPVSVVLADAAGNRNAPYTTVAANTASITGAPVMVTSVTSADTCAGSTCIIGESITFTLTPQTPTLGTVASNTYNTQSLTWSTSDNGATYSATYTVQAGEPDTTPLQLSGVVLTDTSNKQSAQQSTSDVTKGIDANAPIVHSLSLVDGVYTTGDTITLAIDADGTGYTDGTITINGVAGTNFRYLSGTTYFVDYVVAPGDTDRAPGTIPVSVNIVDAAGNPSTTYTSVAANTASIDTSAPTVISVVANPTTGTLHPADSMTITVTLDENATVTGTVNNEAVTFNTNGVTSTVTYTVTASSVAQTQDALPIDFVATDSLGNSVNITAFTSGTPAIDPTVPPVITPPSVDLTFEAPYYTFVGQISPLSYTVTPGTFVINYASLTLDGATIVNGSTSITAQIAPARGSHTAQADTCDVFANCDQDNSTFQAYVPVQAVSGSLSAASGLAGDPVQATWTVRDIDNAYNTVHGLSGFINCGDGTPERDVVLNGAGAQVSDTCTPAAAGTYTIQFGVKEYGADYLLSDGSVNPSAVQTKSTITRVYVAN